MPIPHRIHNHLLYVIDQLWQLSTNLSLDLINETDAIDMMDGVI